MFKKDRLGSGKLAAATVSENEYRVQTLVTVVFPSRVDFVPLVYFFHREKKVDVVYLLSSFKLQNCIVRHFGSTLTLVVN